MTLLQTAGGLLLVAVAFVGLVRLETWLERRWWARQGGRPTAATRSPAMPIPPDPAVVAAGTTGDSPTVARAQVRHLKWMWSQPTVDEPDLRSDEESER